jgi:hypothetical protein
VTLASLFQAITFTPRPEIAKFYARILIMPGLYSLSAAISLFALRYAYFIGIVRYAYEAYALYLYGLLLFAYVGGESKAAQILKDYATEHVDSGAMTCCPDWCMRCTMCHWTRHTSAIHLVRTWKLVLIQYFFVKTIIETVIAFWQFYARTTPTALEVFGVRSIALVSLIMLMYGLITLYVRLMSPIGHPFQSLAKLVVIKV